MSGYYEWQDTPGGKQPWYFTARDSSPLLTAAGLWDEWKDRQTGERLKSCTMIITEPNHFAAEVHDRMPVFLTQQQFVLRAASGCSGKRMSFRVVRRFPPHAGVACHWPGSHRHMWWSCISRARVVRANADWSGAAELRQDQMAGKDCL
jgi:SOS response associated peptidase (SRAP)